MENCAPVSDARLQQMRADICDQILSTPLSVLERGYAIVTTEDQEIVRDPDQIKEGDRMKIRVERGTFRAQKIG